MSSQTWTQLSIVTDNCRTFLVFFPALIWRNWLVDTKVRVSSKRNIPKLIFLFDPARSCFSFLTVIELMTCFHEISAYECTNFFTHISQLTNFFLVKKGIWAWKKIKTNLFVTSKSEVSNSPIHEFKGLHKSQRAFQNSFFMVC